MSLTAIFPWKKATQGRDSNGAALAYGNGEEKGGIVPFEMDVHVPCRVSGKTCNRSGWEGETTTLSISSFGAHLLLPADAELEGDIELTFKVPAPLATLFVRKKFRVNAEVKSSGAVGPGFSSKGRKVIGIVFAEVLYFNLKRSRNRA